MPDWSLVLAGAGAGLTGLFAAMLLRRPRAAFALASIAAASVLVGRDLAEWQVLVGVCAWTLLAAALALRVRQVGVAGFAVGLAVGGLVWLPVATALPGTAADGLRTAAMVSLPVTVVVVWIVARRLGPARTWVVVAAGTVCVYGAVPDTEQISVLAAMVVVTSMPLLVRRLPHVAAGLPHPPPRTSVGGAPTTPPAAPPIRLVADGAAERAATRWSTPLASPLAEVVPLASARRGPLHRLARIHWEPMTMGVVSIAGLAVWAAATGSVGREAAFVAGPGCVLAPAVLAYLGDIVIRRPAHAPWGVGDLVVIGIPVATAAIVARTAGLAVAVDDAVSLGAMVVAFGMLVTLCGSLWSSGGLRRATGSAALDPWRTPRAAVDGTAGSR